VIDYGAEGDQEAATFSLQHLPLTCWARGSAGCAGSVKGGPAAPSWPASLPSTGLFGNMDWRACLQSLVQDTQHNLAAIPTHGSYQAWPAKKVGAGTHSH
jgi:hypothetical protein